MDTTDKVRFLSVLNGTSPGSTHGTTYMFISKADVIKMVKDGFIVCAHPEEWGGETAWPAPEMSITEKGREWLDKVSRLVTLTSTQRVVRGEKEPQIHNGFWG